MARPDDSTLDPEDLRAVEEQAHRLLDRADAWDRYPVPVHEILDAANVRLAPTSAFDADAIVSYLRGKAAAARARVKSAMSKVLGLYDAGEGLIHIDGTVVKAKQTFLKLHETGHHDIPWHRKMFRFFQDCRKTLAPDVADRFRTRGQQLCALRPVQGSHLRRTGRRLPVRDQDPHSACKEVRRFPLRLRSRIRSDEPESLRRLCAGAAGERGGYHVSRACAPDRVLIRVPGPVRTPHQQGNYARSCPVARPSDRTQNDESDASHHLRSQRAAARVPGRSV